VTQKEVLKTKNREDKPKVISYLRVSTDSQNTEKNKQAVRAYANKMNFPKVSFVEEKVSGKVPWKERKIKDVIDSVGKGDKLIFPELSRLGRSTFEIMEILSIAKENEIDIYDIKNDWVLNGSIHSEDLAFCFSIAARIERDFLIQRTVEGRRAAKARGVKFGRPRGPGSSKLDKYREEIVALLKTGSRQNYIAEKFSTTPGGDIIDTKGPWMQNFQLRLRRHGGRFGSVQSIFLLRR